MSLCTRNVCAAQPSRMCMAEDERWRLALYETLWIFLCFLFTLCSYVFSTQAGGRLHIARPCMETRDVGSDEIIGSGIPIYERPSLYTEDM